MSERCGLSQIVFSPMAQGVLSGKYEIGKPLPAGSRATDEKGGARTIQRYLSDEILQAVADLKPIADELGITTRPACPCLGSSKRQRRCRNHSGASRPSRSIENVKAADVVIPAELMARIDDVLFDVIIDDPSLTWENAPHERPRNPSRLRTDHSHSRALSIKQTNNSGNRPSKT